MRQIARILLVATTAAVLEVQAADPTDISGTVTGPTGPEASVWVIAETTELPTRFARIVVTDDKGRYLIPDLPNVGYSVWVRGYGLVDSPKIRANPGRTLNLTAVPAPNEAAAAHYYPAIHWYSMMKLPKPEDFGGKGRIPAAVSEQLQQVAALGCRDRGDGEVVDGQYVDSRELSPGAARSCRRRGLRAILPASAERGCRGP